MLTSIRDGISRIDAIQVSVEEVQETILRIFQFFAAGTPGKTEIGLREIVEGFARLGEPPQLTQYLTQLLTPILDTFPRSV